jgi:hypothetical protein
VIVSHLSFASISRPKIFSLYRLLFSLKPSSAPATRLDDARRKAEKSFYDPQAFLLLLGEKLFNGIQSNVEQEVRAERGVEY